jgi:hypothetical protein
VDVVKQYARVAGLRVPIRIESTAQIRLAGTSTMTMTYEYEMINGVNVSASRASSQWHVSGDNLRIQGAQQRSRHLSLRSLSARFRAPSAARGSDPVLLPDRHLEILLQLAANAGRTISEGRLDCGRVAGRGGRRQQHRAGNLQSSARRSAAAPTGGHISRR